MKPIYVTKTFILTFSFITFILISKGWWIFLSIYILVNLGYVYFNYIKLNHLRDSLVEATDTFLSPCDGKVIGIKEEDTFKKLKIKMSLLNRWALFLPQSSTLELLSRNQGKRYWRLKKTWPDDDHQSTTMALRNKADVFYFIKFFPSFLGFSALLYMKTGDRGKIGANFGRFYFGGTIILELPNSVDIMVSIGDRVKAGETIVAQLNDED